MTLVSHQDRSQTDLWDYKIQSFSTDSRGNSVIVEEITIFPNLATDKELINIFNRFIGDSWRVLRESKEQKLSQYIFNSKNFETMTCDDMFKGFIFSILAI